MTDADTELQVIENIEELATDVTLECERHLRLWGVQDHPDFTPGMENRSGIERCRFYDIPTEGAAKSAYEGAKKIGVLSWADILLEEFVEAIAAKDVDELRTELLQVAAVSLSWVDSIDRRKNDRNGTS